MKVKTNKLVRDKVCEVMADRGIAKSSKCRYAKAKNIKLTFLQN